MASWNSTHGSHHYPRTQRHDSYAPPSHYDRQPPAGYETRPQRRSFEHERMQPYDQRPQNNPSDPRYHYPPPLPRISRSVGRPSSPPLRKRRPWPPPPSVEDESDALKRGAGTAVNLRAFGTDEAVSRGSIDQEPVIQDNEEYINIHERRFVFLSGSGSEARKQPDNPTPPTSEDEKLKRGRPRLPKLKTDFDRSPELGRKTSYPDVSTKPTSLRREASSRGIFLSPEILIPPPTGSSSRKTTRSGTGVQTLPRQNVSRDGPLAKQDDHLTAKYLPDDNPVNDPNLDLNEPAGLPSRRKPARYSFSKADLPKTSTTTSVQDFATNMSATIPPLRMPVSSLEYRSNTDTAANTQPNSYIGKAGGLVESSPTTPRLAADSYPPNSMRNSRQGSRQSPRASSPISSHLPLSPPKSPRLRPTDRSVDKTPGSSPNSQPTSRHCSALLKSAEGSRPSSPGPTRNLSMPQTDDAWSALLTANTARKATRPSKLSSSLGQESMSAVPRVSTKSASPARPARNTLPYPEDDVGIAIMPSEREYLPGKASALEYASAYEAKTISSAQNMLPSTSPRNSKRPQLPQSQHSEAGTSPTATRSSISARPASAETRQSFSGTSKAKTDAPSLGPKALPPCPRPDFVHGYDDWYTLSGDKYLRICPSCVSAVFAETIYHQHLRRAPPCNPSVKTKCDFSSPWIRLAWLLTLQHKRTDLNLLEAIAAIDATSEPCPGNVEAVRSWRGFVDIDRHLLQDFYVCHSDLRKILRLLPKLCGFWINLSHIASERQTCCLRTRSNRFSTYMDELIAMHDDALATRKIPNTSSFFSLVWHKAKLRDCTRDDMLVGQLWHFIPSVPALTVCEDCFDSVVLPLAAKNSDVAMRFNRTAQPAHKEGRLGTSCQLYSPRMRKIFKRAVEDKDLRYLAKKALERKEVEVQLQDTVSEIRRRAGRIQRLGREDEERLLKIELEAVADEWAKWE